MKPMESDPTRIRRAFEKLSEGLDRSTILETDPIRFVYRYTRPRDRELVGILSAFFAYGNVTAIVGFLDRLLPILGKNPGQSIREYKPGQIDPSIYYRFQSTSDIDAILFTLGQMMGKRPGKGLEWLFGNPGDLLGNRIRSFRRAFFAHLPVAPTPGIVHWCGKEDGTGASKRMLMFLRWMVRTDWPDTGLYSTFSPADLVVPLDVHIGNLARRFGWTARKANDWKAAVEITKYLKKIRPEDPVGFDFALTRPGITGACDQPERCSVCPLHPFCFP